MNLSVKEMDRKFKEFATNHREIQTYKSDSSVKNIEKDITYPLLWVSFGDLIFSKNGKVEQKIEVNVFDRLTDDGSNDLDVQNDTAFLINDFYTWFNDNEEEFGFFIDDDAICTPVVAAFDDNVGGWGSDIAVVVRNINSERIIPMK